MPNHVVNRIAFFCSDEKADEILKSVMYDPKPDDEENTGPGTIDFGKLIPMPKSLMIEAGSTTTRGIEIYLTAVNPDTEDYDLPKMPKDKFDELVNALNGETIIGIICIVLALVVTFGVAPLVSRMDSNKVNIVRITRNVSQGHAVTENDVEIAEVGNYNLPSDVIRKKEDVVGKFAATDLKAGDYLFPSKLTDSSDNANDVFRTLKGDKQAISITIRSFAGGLSGKLQNGDIVQLVVYQNNADEAIIPAELTYLKVITTTTSEGIDRDELTVNEDGTYELPSTVTLLVNQKQAKLLVQYENSGRIHADLVYRGDEATAQKYLDAQEAYFKALSETETSEGSSESNVNNGGDDVISRANDIINGRVPSYVYDKEESADE